MLDRKIFVNARKTSEISPCIQMDAACIDKAVQPDWNCFDHCSLTR